MMLCSTRREEILAAEALILRLRREGHLGLKLREFWG